MLSHLVCAMHSVNLKRASHRAIEQLASHALSTRYYVEFTRMKSIYEIAQIKTEHKSDDDIV